MECNITWSGERPPQPRNSAKEKEWQIWNLTLGLLHPWVVILGLFHIQNLIFGLLHIQDLIPDLFQFQELIL